MNSMGIGKLAALAGVSVDTVRYYEKSGLLPPDERLPSGYRRYGELQVSRLRFIRRAQALGFSLKEIRDLLVARPGRVRDDGAAGLASERCRLRDGSLVGVVDFDYARAIGAHRLYT